MENFESFEEEKKHLSHLPKEAQWLHKVKDEKMWGLDEPSILFTSNIMSKIKAKQEKPVFNKGIMIFFGLVWAVILGLAVWKSLEKLSPSHWEIPRWDFSKLPNLANFEASSTLMMFAYLLVVFWGLFLLNRVLQKNANEKSNQFQKK
jgi:hypothetical protein